MNITAFGVIGIWALVIALCSIKSELSSITHYLEELDYKHSKEYKI